MLHEQERKRRQLKRIVLMSFLHFIPFFDLFFFFFSRPVLDCPALTLQSSRSLDTLSDLKLQRLEAELEGARHEAQGACQREVEMKVECERLKEEMRQLQNSQRERVSVCLHRY